jgi:tetratricopeptide (TPR) repeat protein
VDLAYLIERVTEADPELAGAAGRRQPSTGPVPRQLPAAVAHFAGRSGELAALTGLVCGRADTGGTVVISAIGGTAGVGKTALAVYWAHQVSDRFPDGQLYVNLRGFDPSGQVMAPAEAVRRFLDAPGVSAERIPVDLDAQAALYRSQLAGKRVLVVLDNARDTAQVRPLLPGAPTCLVLVTSRNQLTGLIAADSARPITLDLLTDDEARQLLARRLGADRVAAEPDAVAEIITGCAHLPLALALVAARAAIRPHLGLPLLAEELRDTQDRWQALAGDDPTTDVRVVFSWSHRALTQDAARLFRLLGLHPGPDLSAPAAASLAGVPASTVRPLLGELTRASLLVEHTPGRYSFHDLLRAYAAHLTRTTDTAQQRHSATVRILDHYLHTAHTADRLLDPTGDPTTLIAPQPGVTPEPLTDYRQAMDWFTIEHPVLLAAVDHAAATGLDTHTWQLIWTLDPFLGRRGHWHDWAASARAAVAAAHRLADPPAQIRTHSSLAAAYIPLGRFDDAHTELGHALDLATQIGDQTGQANVHRILAYLWEQRGGYPQALDHAWQALDLCQAAGHQRGQARALSAVGWYHALLGEYQQALTACQQALTLHQDLNNREGQANTWASLGYAHHHLGNRTHALTCYQHAFTLYRDLGDRYYEARHPHPPRRHPPGHRQPAGRPRGMAAGPDHP